MTSLLHREFSPLNTEGKYNIKNQKYKINPELFCTNKF